MSGAEWSLAGLSESDLYDHLRTVIEASFETFADDNVENNANNGRTDSDFVFETGEGRVNLLGVRGFDRDSMTACTSTSMAWDDTCFLVFVENGRKRVESYYLNTEQNMVDVDEDPDGGKSFLVPGNHRYKLGLHRSEQRALRPYSVVATVYDKNQNFVDDEGMGLQWIGSINVHYGGAGSTPVGWSLGCQTIRYEDDWDAMRTRIESDHSIIGTIDNEFASKPARDGDRVLLYTLVTGDALRPGAAGPVIADPVIADPVVVDPVPGPYVPEPQPGAPGGATRPERNRPERNRPGRTRPGTRPGGDRNGSRPNRAGGEGWRSRPTIAVGSQGEDVEVVQRRLTKLDFDPGPIDGVFGNRTDAAVRRFQSARDLEVDGIVGPQTWEALAKRRRRKARANSRT